MDAAARSASNSFRAFAGNRLADAGSRYLRGHAGDPVFWQPWDGKAFALAAREGIPILLSIGYLACHWCHVMARESFADPDTAAVMNRHFVCIKVDREERPDLDRLYLGALARLGVRAGWPLTAFLTPDGDAYWGGGYFPPTASFGLPAFADALQDAAARFHAAAGDLTTPRAPASWSAGRRGGTTTVGPALLDRVAHELARSIDGLYGGFGIDPPKFLHAGGHEMLLRAWARTGEPGLLQAAIGSLVAICDSAVYDHVGGGFHRYAADDRWLVPHFEKMLCDNALMIGLLVKAWQATQMPLFACRVARCIDWLLREMRLPDGTFASSLGASGIKAPGPAGTTTEGSFYTWAPGETCRVLGVDHPNFAAAYGESAEGPFAPRAVVFRHRKTPTIVGPDREAAAQAMLARLRQVRERRERPIRDDKVLADWNGLAITALTEAGLAFGRPDWIAAARAAFAGVVARLAGPDGLRHCGFDAAPGPPGFLEDHACLAQAALALHEATGEAWLVAEARAWTATLDAAFWDDAEGGYAMSRVDATSQQTPTVRQVLIDETAAPSGNGTMLGVLARLAALTGDAIYRRRATSLINRFADRLTRASVAGATALNNSLAPWRLVQIVVVGAPTDPARAELLREVASRFVPDRLLVVHDGEADLPTGHPAFGKTLLAGQARAYVCVGTMCLAPIVDVAALREALVQASRSEFAAAD